jgi:hypothetical protein
VQSYPFNSGSSYILIILFFEKVALPVRSAGVLVGGRQLTGIDAENESESDEVRWGRGRGWFGGIQDSGRFCESEECSRL